MNTLSLNHVDKTKKLIELPNDVCRHLAIQAAVMGTSVKKLIETLVINALKDNDDESLYAYLVQTRPEGHVMLSDNEQGSLLKRLRDKASADEI